MSVVNRELVIPINLYGAGRQLGSVFNLKALLHLIIITAINHPKVYSAENGQQLTVFAVVFVSFR